MKLLNVAVSTSLNFLALLLKSFIREDISKSTANVFAVLKRVESFRSLDQLAIFECVQGVRRRYDDREKHCASQARIGNAKVAEIVPTR